MIDVDSLKSRTDIAQVVGHFVPLLKRGREWVGKCVAHSPDNHPSMWIAPQKGLIHCFACGWSGDVIDFLMHVEGVDFRTACERLGATDQWTPQVSVPQAPPQPARITSKPPADTESPDMTLRGLGRPSRVWPYRDADGDLLGYAARYENEDGKEFRCWTWGARGDEPAAWGVGHWNRPRPLYGLDRLTTRATAPVVIVEGERAADAAGRLLPNYVAVTWPGGAQAVHHADWEAMRGRRALLWPDNDEAGLKAMNGLAAVLADPAGLGCSVRLLDPNRESDGFDAADAEESGWTTAQVIEWAKPRASAWTVKQADTAQDEPPTTETGAEPPPADDMAENPPMPPVSLPETQAPRRQRPRLSVVSNEGAAAPALDDEPLPLALSEVGVAAEFVATHKDDLRYVPEWKRWVVWNGERWEPESKKRVEPLARLTVLCNCLKHRPEAAAVSPSGKAKLESRPYIYSVMELAECSREVQAKPGTFDTDPWLIGTPAGTIDLRLGKLVAAEREHYITRRTTVVPAPGPMPLFERVIECATGGSAELRAYLWRWLGYCLTGDVREESFLFLYGKAQSGKTTFVEAIAGILGDSSEGGYSTGVDMDLFCESRNDRGHDRLAGLAGARFAYASETEEGRHWKPSLLKWATGGDTLRGRRLYEESFNFRPSHKLCVFGNHKPHLRSADDGVKRRIHLLEYHGAITDADRDLTFKTRLVAEYPAILARMIEGCLDWQRCEGLKKPDEITSNVDNYFESEDILGSWIEEKCVRSKGSFLPSADAYRSYSDYVMERGERAPTQKRFSMMMQGHDFKLGKQSGARGICDLRLNTVHDAPLPPIPDNW